MPIYERYLIWTNSSGEKEVSGLGPVFSEAQSDARASAKEWGDKMLAVPYEVVVRQVLEQ